MIEERFAKEQRQGHPVSACLHVTCENGEPDARSEDGRTEVRLCASNPLSTQDDVAAALVKELGHPHLRHPGRGQGDVLQCISRALDAKPNLTMDDGADTNRRDPQPAQGLVADVDRGHRGDHHRRLRLKGMERDGVLLYRSRGERRRHSTSSK